jgi:hypothetical protein
MGVQRATFQQARAQLAGRLRARLPEIEEAILTRIHAVAEQGETEDPEYADGLRSATLAAVEYGLQAVERGEDGAPPVPAALLSQARLAARNSIGLGTVLRRYLVGYTLLGDFLISEGREVELRGTALQHLLRAQAALFDRVIASVGEEYGREARGRVLSSEARRTKRLRRLLDGEPLDTSELGYEFTGWHVGIVVAGPEGDVALKELAQALDGRLLRASSEDGVVWGWLGSRAGFALDARKELAARSWPSGTSIALGEPGEGIAGWRLTHRQARAALPIALRTPSSLVHYADVILLAAALRDDLLATSLRQLYLEPFSHERDGGKTTRETLRAYFDSSRNISSAAALLDVKRHTVTNRLRMVEEQLGRPLNDCASGLDTALRMELVADPLLPYHAFSSG